MKAPQTEILKALENSDVGRQALAELEAKRSAERAAVLTVLNAQLGELSEKEQAARTLVAKLQPAVLKAQAAYLSALAELQEAQRQASDASFAQDSARGRARRQLVGLGVEVIHQTRLALLDEQHRLRNAMEFRPDYDDRGKFKAMVPKHPEVAERLAVVAEHLAGLDALELADLDPSAIEARCAAMQDGSLTKELPAERGCLGVRTKQGTVISRELLRA